MAGYVITLKDEEALMECIKTGIYSTKLTQPKGSWKVHHEGTFADYLSMKPGDNIYFFIKRKIYGTGVLVEVEGDCKFSTFIDSTVPEFIKTKKALKEREPIFKNITAENRCFCVFKPSPYFFSQGVDMDETLNSAPEKFKMLRVLWKLSFIKIDDEENKKIRHYLTLF